jgi:outer membrane protein insertion porin family
MVLKNASICLLTLFCVIAASPLVWAQESERALTVKEISIKGTKNTRVSEIRAALPFRVGAQVADRDLELGRDAIERLGLFQSVDYARKIDEGQVYVTYIVEENPVVKRINITGNQTYTMYIDLWLFKIPYKDKLVRKDDILDALKEKGIEPDRVLNTKWFAEEIIRHTIVELYQKKGFAFIGVGGGFDPEKSALDIQILEGQLEELTLTGLETVPLAEAEKLVKIPRDEPVRLQPVQEAFLKISKSVYFLPSDARDIQVVQGSALDKVKIIWTLHERQVLEQPEPVNQIEFTGVTLYPLSRLQSKLGRWPAAPIDNYQLLQVVRGVFDLYRKDGYMMASFYNEGLQDGTLKLRVNEGRIGQIVIHNPCAGEQVVMKLQPPWGDKPLLELKKQCTPTTIIRKELRIREGQILNENPLRDSFRNLLQLGYFKEGGVNITPKLDSPESGLVTVTVDVLEEDRLGSLNGALSYSGEGGLVGQVKLGWKNVLGTGQDVSFEFDRGVWGKPVTNYKVEYNTHTFPYFRDYTFMNVNVYRETKKEDERQPSQHELTRLGAGFGVGYPLDAYVGLPISLTLRYRYENFEKIYPPVDGQPSELNESGIISAVTLQLNHDNRNNPIFATRGGYQQVALEKAGGFSVGTEFTKLTGQIVHHWMTFEDQAIAVRLVGQIGWELPTQERFLLGSTMSVRGWEGFFTDALAVANLEYRARVTEPAVAVLFFDAGWGRDVEQDKLIQRLSFGAEAQIDTPVLGKVRLIISMKIFDEEPHIRWVPVFQFGLGTMF